MGNESNTQWVLTSLVSLLSSCSSAPTSALKPNFMVSSYTVFVSSLLRSCWNTDHRVTSSESEDSVFGNTVLCMEVCFQKEVEPLTLYIVMAQVIVDARINK